MKDQDVFNEVLTRAYKRMHRYTCAEASLQALLSLWNFPQEGYSWATAGYLDAIMSGETTCVLLIGSSIAIGLRCGHGKDKIPEEHENERNTAIEAVRELYNDFLKEFGSTKCKTLTSINFSKGEEVGRYISTKAWKQTCDIFLDFVMRKSMSMSEEGKV